MSNNVGRNGILGGRSVPDPVGAPNKSASTHRAVTSPAGTPYHQMARTERHRWWRPLVGTLLVVASGLVGISVAIKGVHGLPLAAIWAKAATNLLLGLLIPVVFLAAWWVQRRAPGSVSSVAGRLRWRWQLICASLAMLTFLMIEVLLGIGVALAGVFGQPAVEAELTWVGWLPFFGATVLMLLTVPLQAAGEEYLCRGWVIQFFGCYLRTPWVGIVIGGLLFTLLHSPTTVWAWAYLMLLSVVLGWLVICTGGLEAAIAFHAVGNFVASLFAAASGGLNAVPNAGDAKWAALLIESIPLALYAGTILVLARQFALVPVPAAHSPTSST